MTRRRLPGTYKDPAALAIAEHYLFVVERDGRVLGVPSGGGEPEALAEVSAPVAAASDGAALWVAEFTEEGALLRIDADGAESVVDGLPFPVAITVFGPVILVACVGEDRDGGGLAAVSKDGGKVRWIGRGLQGPAGLAAQDGTAWLLDAAGSLVAVPLEGGDPRIVTRALAGEGTPWTAATSASLGGGPYVLAEPSALIRPVVAAEGAVAWLGWDGRLRRLVDGASALEPTPTCNPPDLLACAVGTLYAASNGAIVRTSCRAGMLSPFVEGAHPKALAASARMLAWVDVTGALWTLETSN